MKSIIITCGCGHQWWQHANPVDFADIIAERLCMQCRRPGASAGRSLDTVGDPCRQLAWGASRGRYVTVLGWTSTLLRPHERDTTGPHYAVSLRTRYAGHEIGYEIFARPSGQLTEAMRIIDGEIEQVSWDDVPGHLRDLAKSIVIDSPPIADWQRWTRAAVAAAKSGDTP